MYIVAANNAGAIKMNMICTTYGPSVQFGVSFAETARPTYPIHSTAILVSLDTLQLG